MKDMILVEKYRPQKFEEIVGLSPTLIQIIKEELPNLLLLGKPGVGKTTLGKVIIKELGLERDSLVLNASDERGIDTIREKVKNFAMTKSNNNKIKLVLLDEADYLTIEAQTTLRNMMETYSSNCRFILTANYKNKIIEPLQSRCIKVDFTNIKKEDILHRLKDICIAEGIVVDENTLKEVIELNYPDIRSMIQLIQKYKSNLNVEIVRKENSSIVSQILLALKNSKFIMARQIYLDNNLNEEETIVKLHDLILEDRSIPPEQKKDCILYMDDCQDKLSRSANKSITLEAMFIRIMRVLNVRPT